MKKITKSIQGWHNNNSTLLSILIALTLFVQLNAFGQESIDPDTKKPGVMRTESMITSRSTDNELYDQEKFYANEFGLSLKFKKILRDNNNEIKGLKIILSDGKEIKKAYNVSEEDPIKSFTIFVDKEENNILTFGFGDPTSILLIAENHKNQKLADLNVAKEQSSLEAKTISEETDEEMDSPEVTGDDDISVLRRDKNINYKKAFISLNGKEITPTEMEKIDPKSIGSLSVLNSRNNDRLVEKYGEKAQNGAILIETMFVARELTTKDINELPENFKLDKESGAFIIHKNSQQSDIEFYEHKLAEIGVVLLISGVERNTQGQIAAIKIKLDDKVNKTQMSDWVSFKNANGIINIFVGRKNGKVNISTR